MSVRPENLQVEHNLQNLAINYTPTEFNLVAERVMPSIGTEKLTGSFYQFNKADRFTIPKTSRGPRGQARGTEFGKTKLTYSCEGHAQFDFITDTDRDNSDSPFPEDANATEGLIDLLWLAREKRVADMLVDPTQITNNTTLVGPDQFSDYANSDPISVIDTAKAAIFGSANTIVVSKAVHVKIKNHPAIQALVSANVNKVLTTDLLAELFEVQNYLVADAEYNTAKPGQSAAYGPVWGKHMLVCYVRPTPDKTKPSLAYTFRYKLGSLDGTASADGRNAVRVRKGRDEVTGGGGDYIEADQWLDEKVVAVDEGYVVLNAIA